MTDDYHYRLGRLAHEIESAILRADEDCRPVPEETKRVAISAACWLVGVGASMPDSVYVLPDGGLLLEWGEMPGVVRRFEVGAGERGGLLMTSYPDAASTFVEWGMKEVKP